MLSNFIAEVKTRGLARTNRYQVLIPFPNTNSTGSNLVTLFCYSASIPGMTVASSPIRTFGEPREMPYDRMFEPVQLDFYVDSNVEVRGSFERWIHLISNQTSRVLSYYRDYIRDITITLNDMEDRTPYSITLFEAYPKQIMGNQLRADSRDPMMVSVIMQYKYWKSSASENTNSSSIPPYVVTGSETNDIVLNSNVAGTQFIPRTADTTIISTDNTNVRADRA